MRHFAHRYEPGTEVQEKSGRVKKKIFISDTEGCKWMSRGRYNFMQKYKVDLTENDKVYHIDGNKENDDPSNLVAIHFNAVRVNISHSRVVWEPPKTQKYKPYIPHKTRELAIA
jgi:hypothetical protein